MVYNDTSTSLGICQEIDALCDSDTTSYPVADKTRRVNSALEQVVGWLINADGTAQFDDTNYTDFPIGTYTMVASQSKYSFNDKFLQIINVQVKDVSGNWQKITPIDQSEYNGVLEEDFETAGMPIYYDKLSDDTLKLYPAPSATSTTLTLGLRIYFKRTSHPFVAGDTTAEPGFASPYHIILCYMASIPFCMSYKKDRVALYEKKIMDLKKELIDHYSQREKDKRKQITFNPVFPR
jgi:hypothetical protein